MKDNSKVTAVLYCVIPAIALCLIYSHILFSETVENATDVVAWNAKRISAITRLIQARTAPEESDAIAALAYLPPPPIIGRLLERRGFRQPGRAYGMKFFDINDTEIEFQFGVRRTPGIAYMVINWPDGYHAPVKHYLIDVVNIWWLFPKDTPPPE